MNFLFLNSARAWGGNEQWTYLAGKALAQEHTVVFAYRSKDVGERLPEPQYRLPFLNEGDPITLTKLTQIVRRHRIDVLIPTKRKDYVLAGIVARITGTKNILRLGIVRSLGNQPINRLIYDKLCHGIIVNAQSIRNVLLHSAFMRPEKIRIIYNGVDLAEIRRKVRNEEGFARPFPFTVITMGWLSRRKGVDFLLRGFARFRKSRSDTDRCGLLIVGEGPDERFFRSLAGQLGLSDAVRFWGYRNNPYPILAACDVFALTSLNEGIPNAMLEAMALRKPVIVTRAGGTAEAIRDGENGLLVRFGDEQELANALGLLYERPELRQKLGEQGHLTVLSQFSTERMAREIARFCAEV